MPAAKKGYHKPGFFVFLRKADLTISFLNTVSLCLIFFSRQFFFPVFLFWGRGLFLPINAIANLSRGTLSTYEARKRNWPWRNVVRAAVFAIGGAAMATAIIGSLVAATTFALVNPILTIIGMGLRCLYYAGMGILRFCQLPTITDPVERNYVLWDAIADIINSVGNGCCAVAVGFVLIAFNASFGLLGLAGGIIGIIGASCEWMNIREEKPKGAKAKDSTIVSFQRLRPLDSSLPSPTPQVNNSSQQQVVGNSHHVQPVGQSPDQPGPARDDDLSSSPKQKFG